MGVARVFPSAALQKCAYILQRKRISPRPDDAPTNSRVSRSVEAKHRPRKATVNEAILARRHQYEISASFLATYPQSRRPYGRLHSRASTWKANGVSEARTRTTLCWFVSDVRFRQRGNVRLRHFQPQIWQNALLLLEPRFARSEETLSLAKKAS
jgi:hypothetical protein